MAAADCADGHEPRRRKKFLSELLSAQKNVEGWGAPHGIISR